MGSIHEKPILKKSRDTTPLTYRIYKEMTKNFKSKPFGKDRQNVKPVSSPYDANQFKFYRDTVPLWRRSFEVKIIACLLGGSGVRASGHLPTGSAQEGGIQGENITILFILKYCIRWKKLRGDGGFYIVEYQNF